MTPGTPAQVAVSGAAVERYMTFARDLHQPHDLCDGGCVEVIKATDHDAAIAALTAELQQCRQALEAALPRMTHRIQCYRCRPTEEWTQRGSASFDGCECEIRQVRAALKEGA